LVRILETVPRRQPTNLKKNGFGLCGPLSGFFTPSRDEFVSLISKGSSDSALRVLAVDALSQCVTLFQLFRASRVR
jgi:hypothetical protein